MPQIASILTFLSDKIPQHCREHIETEMGLKSTDPNYDKELRDQIRMMELDLWIEDDIIGTAYYMKIPKNVLYRFGYTDKEINEQFLAIFDESQFPDGYPY